MACGEVISTVNDHSVPQFIQIKPLEYRNKNAISNLIHYITRTRPNETRANELLSYGTDSGFPCIKTPEEIIDEFEYIAKSYHTKGSLLVHYIIWPPEDILERMGSLYQLNMCMVECCRYIFGTCGYQCCYAIHCSKEQCLHIHLVISTTRYCNINGSYYNGKHLKQYYKSRYTEIEVPLLQIFKSYMSAEPMFTVYPHIPIPSLD